MSAHAVTIIFSPYHVGTRDHRVGNGPHRIRQFGVVEALEALGLTVFFKELEHVD
jgi:arginase